MIDWFSILPHMLLAGGGFLLFCIGAFWRPRSAGLLLGVALIAVLSAGAGVLLITPQANRFLGMLEVQGYGRFFAFLICAITVLTLLFCHQYAQSPGYRRR